MLNRNKVRGCLLGVGIGDALGKSIESLSPAQIIERHGIERIDHYLAHNGDPGDTTDDTQLTLCVAESLIEGDYDLSVHAKHHIEEFKKSTKGWGGTTRAAVRNLMNGSDWKSSGVGEGTRGRGNGVPMKISPVAIYLRAMAENDPDKVVEILQEGFSFIRDFTIMTHKTQMAVCATIGYTVALLKCFHTKFDENDLPGYILSFSKQAKKWFVGEETDDIVERFALLEKCKEYNANKLIGEFGGGSCYCYNSIPFTLMFFLRNPRSIECLFDCVSAGGDADTNGAMLGALLGALNGEDIFPQYLVEGLIQKYKILDTADRLCDKLGILE